MGRQKNSEHTMCHWNFGVEGSSVWSKKEMPTILKNISVNIEGTIISTGAVDWSYGNLITWSVCQHAIWTSFSRVSGAKSFSISDALAIVNWCGNISSQRLAITGVITILNGISKLSWTTLSILVFLLRRIVVWHTLIVWTSRRSFHPM